MNSTNNESILSLKQQFKIWLEQEQKDDEMIAFATIPYILRRFDRRLAIIKGNQFEKRYLSEWRKLFRIDKELTIIAKEQNYEKYKTSQSEGS